MPDGPPRRLLSIGLGTGILVGEVARHPGVEAVDCVEISPSVIEAAREFDRFNGGVLEDPRARVITDDGVNFLRRTDLRYDAIVSDAKSRTKHAANATFFSADYYRLCREHLASGGLMLQWLPLDVPPRELRTILRTFGSVFANVYVLVGAPGSCFLVGSEEPLVVDTGHVARLLGEPATEHLRRYGLRDGLTLLSYMTADRVSLKEWLSSEEEINTLDHPVLEFYSPRGHAVPPARRNDENLLGLLSARHGYPPGSFRLRGAGMGALEAWSRAAGGLADAVAVLPGRDGGSLAQFRTLAQEALRAARGNPVLAHTAAAAYRHAVEASPGDASLHHELAGLLEALGRTPEAAAHHLRTVELRPDDPQARVELGLILKRLGRLDEAGHHLGEALRMEPDRPLALTALAEILATRPEPEGGDPAEAVRLAGRAAELTEGRNPHVLNTLATAYASAGEYERAVATGEAALRLASSPQAAALANEIGRGPMAPGLAG
jgi:spermidine synthase